MLLRAKPPLAIAAHKARMLQVRDDQCAAAVASFKHCLNSEVEVVQTIGDSDRLSPRNLNWFLLGRWKYNCQDDKRKMFLIFLSCLGKGNFFC